MGVRTHTVVVGLAIALLVAPAGLGDVSVRPGTGVRFSNGFTCSFRGKKVANKWLTDDPAFLGPTVICGGASYKPWNSSVLTHVWVASDGTVIREVSPMSSKRPFLGLWGISAIPPAGNVPETPDGYCAGHVGDRRVFKPVSRLVTVPDATLVRFGSTGVACAVFRAADSEAVLGYAMASPTSPDLFTMCRTSWHDARTQGSDCVVWTAVLYGQHDQFHFYRQRLRDSSGTEYTTVAGGGARPFGCRA